MAQRIETRDARIPAPTPDLFNRMARQGYEAAYLATNPLSATPPAFEGLNQDGKDMWFHVARVMYASVACEGGARINPIDERGHGR